MTVLEVGINLQQQNLIEVQYYPYFIERGDIKNDELPNLRNGLMMALDQFSKSILDKDSNINVINLHSYSLICYTQMIELPGEVEKEKEPLLFYAVIEQTTDPDLVKTLLKEISVNFLNRFPLHLIFSKKQKHFKKFKSCIDDLLGDLKIKSEDRFKEVFFK